MCMCASPNVNGTPGYQWDNRCPANTRPVDPPALQDGDALLYDLPGRCGGCDSHHLHMRIVKRFGSLLLLAQSGLGYKSLSLHSGKGLAIALESMDNNAAYWTCAAIYTAYRDGHADAAVSVGATWRRAAAEDRIKTRKRRGQDAVKVWIEDPKPASAAA